MACTSQSSVDVSEMPGQLTTAWLTKWAIKRAEVVQRAWKKIIKQMEEKTDEEGSIYL